MHSQEYVEQYFIENGYHIDHIIPVVVFIENKIMDPKIINALDNLRIIYCKENWSKNRKYKKDELLNYLIGKGIDEFRE
jgi:hypothetical protein